MIFTLIVPTIHRTQELGRLLESVSGQKLLSLSLGDIEVIIVDQNEDDRLLKVIGSYKNRISIFHLKAPALGQSHAKNIGMKTIRGKYVTFPDDDSFYPEDTLEKVFRIFAETGEKYAFFGRSMDKESGETPLCYPTKERIISRPGDPTVFLGIQYTQFYTADMVRAVGDFDPDLCSGGRWGSGEETDFAIRCLKLGTSIYFKPEILVYHPLVTAETMEKQKLKKYSIGFGALCRKHGFYGIVIWKILKQLAGMFYFFLKLDFKRSSSCRIIACARIEGFWHYPKERT